MLFKSLWGDSNRKIRERNNDPEILSVSTPLAETKSGQKTTRDHSPQVIMSVKDTLIRQRGFEPLINNPFFMLGDYVDIIVFLMIF